MDQLSFLSPAVVCGVDGGDGGGGGDGGDGGGGGGGGGGLPSSGSLSWSIPAVLEQ